MNIVLQEVEKVYIIDVFYYRKQNIGQLTLMELSDEDFVKLGVDDPKIRMKLIEEVKNLPIYDEKQPYVVMLLNIFLLLRPNIICQYIDAFITEYLLQI